MGWGCGRQALIQHDWFLEKECHVKTVTQRECHVMVGVMQLQAKEWQRWPSNHQDPGEMGKQILPHSPQREPTLQIS